MVLSLRIGCQYVVQKILLNLYFITNLQYLSYYVQKNQTAEEGKCHKDVDLLFLLDSSESVRYANWKIVISFVKDLCNRFSLNTTRVAFIRFASEPEIAVPLTQFNSTETRDEAIDNIFYKTGGTRTDIALKKAMEVFPTGEPRNQVIMLLTDGPTNRLEISKDRFVEGMNVYIK